MDIDFNAWRTLPHKVRIEMKNGRRISRSFASIELALSFMGHVSENGNKYHHKKTGTIHQINPEDISQLVYFKYKSNENV